MPNIFFISDTHFGHLATCTVFKRNDGTPLRPFKDENEMNEIMVNNWNKTVMPEDKVYHLGDVCMRDKYLNILARCNGHKRLIRGNHDIFKTKAYMQYFDEIYGIKVLDGMGFTHIPVHPECLNRRGWPINVHGHLHANDMPDGRYFCVSVEHINYTPISMEELKIAIKNKQKRYPLKETKFSED